MPICTQCENNVSIDFVRAHGDEKAGTVDWCQPWNTKHHIILSFRHCIHIATSINK
ncbi:DUF7563 family protein [Natrialba taiwanensis]